MTNERTVYLLQARIGPRGNRAKHDDWTTEGAYLSRAEAVRVAKASARHFPHGWRVYGVPLCDAPADNGDCALETGR